MSRSVYRTTFRETSPHYYGLRSYPARWWKKQDPHFFPVWHTKWDTPKPWDYDPWFDSDGQEVGVVIDTSAVPSTASEPIPTYKAGQYGMGTALARQIIYYARAELLSYRNGQASSRKAKEALDWFFDDSPWTFSFLSCCQYLNLNPDGIRRWCETYADYIDEAYRAGRRSKLVEQREKERRKREREQTLQETALYFNGRTTIARPALPLPKKLVRAQETRSKFVVRPPASSEHAQHLDQHSTFLVEPPAPKKESVWAVGNQYNLPLPEMEGVLRGYLSFIGGALNGKRVEIPNIEQWQAAVELTLYSQYSYKVSHTQTHGAVLYVYLKNTDVP